MKKVCSIFIILTICLQLFHGIILHASTDTGNLTIQDSSSPQSTPIAQSNTETSQQLQDTGIKEKNSELITSDETVETVAELPLTCKSAVLMEASTGKIIFEKDKDLQMEPASITKIMTLLLIFDALDAGKIKLKDNVSVSEHAASMGGSQVYLEPFETQTVDTMIKCISIASANDASVAMAEYIAGSETEFVAQMNKKAKELGMKNTNFENCCGLDESTVHHISTAYDVALMSRALITKHPEISNYSTIWMDKFVHVTKKGESEFGLTNTNKLIRTYNGITGLKTGSTSKAKYCLSATAKRNGMDMIAVVMSAPEPKTRFSEAATLLDYGFANCSLYQDENKELELGTIPIEKGVVDTIQGKVKNKFSYVCLKETDPSKIKKEVYLAEDLIAPINKNDEIGAVVYKVNGKEIGRVPIISCSTVKKETYADATKNLLKKYFTME